MLSLTRPKFFIPMHGTLRHLIHHARLAKEVGVPHGVGDHERAGRGDRSPSELHVREERVANGKVFIDAEAEEVPEVVVRDRQHLSEDGFVIVVVVLDSDARLIRDPEIITRGLVHVDESQDVLDEVRQQLVGIFNEGVCRGVARVRPAAGETARRAEALLPKRTWDAGR